MNLYKKFLETTIFVFLAACGRQEKSSKVEALSLQTDSVSISPASEISQTTGEEPKPFDYAACKMKCGEQFKSCTKNVYSNGKFNEETLLRCSNEYGSWNAIGGFNCAGSMDPSMGCMCLCQGQKSLSEFYYQHIERISKQ